MAMTSTERANRWKKNNPERRKELNKKYYDNNKEKILKRKQKQYKKDKQKANFIDNKNKISREYYHKNKEKIIKRTTAYRKENNDKNNERSRNYIHTLADNYVKRRLVICGIPNNQITQEMIELKRATILLKREAKNVKEK